MTENGRKIARRVREAIEKATPDGMEGWDGALPIVRRPTHRFLDALETWEEEDTPNMRQDLQEAADALVRAWREAGRRFEAEEHPDTREEVPA